MGILLTIAGFRVPGFVRRRNLAKLFSATADAFGTPMPVLDNLDTRRCLREYAIFTKERAEEALRDGTEAEAKTRLYHNAFRLGMTLREEFGVSTLTDTMKLARLVYRIVGIDFHGEPGGEVLVERCFFSDFYSPEVCSLISALDAGLLSGISGGGRLSFYRRITEGSDCCRGRLSMGKKSG